MISHFLILAEGTRQTLFSKELLLLYAFFVGLIIIAAVIFIRFLGSGMKEMKLMRMEVGKVGGGTSAAA